MPNDVPAIVADALSRNPEGLTARKLAGTTNQSLREINDALAAMEAAGIATRTPGPANGNRKGADVWTPAPPAGDTTPDATEDPTADDTASDATDADEATPADDTTPDADEPVTAGDTAPDATDADEATPADDITPDTDEAVPTHDDATPDTDEGVPAGAPVSGAPVAVRRDPDLKVLIMAGVLGDHPEGVSAAVAISESGLAPVMGDTILAAMEVAGAARRLPADEDGTELWVRGEGDLATVDPANAPTHVTCPTCGHTRRIRRPSATGRRASGTGTGRATGDINSDGSEKLGKNGLRNLVEVFMRNLGPGHEVTPHTVGIELGGRSSGACLNAMNKLTGPGILVMTSPAPMKFALADNPPAPTREVQALMPAPTAGDATDEPDTDNADTDDADEALAA